MLREPLPFLKKNHNVCKAFFESARLYLFYWKSMYFLMCVVSKDSILNFWFETHFIIVKDDLKNQIWKGSKLIFEKSRIGR